MKAHRGDEHPRRERADKVRKRNVFGQYGDKARAVQEALLDKYADAGLKSVESLEVLKVDPLTAFGTRPRPASLCRLSPVSAGQWTFPTLSPRALLRMAGPVPRQFAECARPFLPQRHRPSP